MMKCRPKRSAFLLTFSMVADLVNNSYADEVD
jgi:hypothetical protein